MFIIKGDNIPNNCIFAYFIDDYEYISKSYVFAGSIFICIFFY